jgi:hypothetical protein
MAKSKVTQKKVSLSDLNNHNITNKRQALKDLKMLNFDELQYKNSAQKRFYKSKCLLQDWVKVHNTSLLVI